MTPESRFVRIDLQRFASDRTEPATPRRRQEARRKGQVARSGELSTALGILVGFWILYMSAGWVSGEVIAFGRRVLGDALLDFADLDAHDVPALFLEMILVAGKAVAPLLAAAMAVGFLSQLAQVGFLVASEPLRPQLQRINPLSGLKRIFSKRAVTELFKATAKIAVVGYIGYLVARGAFPAFAQFAEWNWQEAVQFTGSTVFRVGLWIALLMLVVAALDFWYQKWEFEQSLRMTKQEVREEHRQTEGDPQIRARIRQRQRQIAGMRMMSKVPTADVVITNPVRLAVALAYDPQTMEAPMVVAKGAGPLARRIRETASEHGVAVVENVWLARALYESADVNAIVPEELYQAVAEVLAFVYRLRRAGA